MVAYKIKEETDDVFISPVNEFVSFLRESKKSSENTLQAYERNLARFAEFLAENNIYSFDEVGEEDVCSYRQKLEREGFSGASISQSLSAIRSLYQYLMSVSAVSVNPAKQVHNVKSAERRSEILTVDEVDRLLSTPNVKDIKGLRDKAMLELLYATGIKVTELVSLDVDDVDAAFNYLHCCKDEKERTIGLYPGVVKILSKYIERSRPMLVSAQDEKSLFVNVSGARMTRQGFWKILKDYAVEAGIKKQIAPHTLRQSLAAHLLLNGADIKEVQDLLGHSDISTTLRYARPIKSKKTKGTIGKYHPRA